LFNLLSFVFLDADIDECKANISNCHTNAVCNNTVGNYTCECECGYYGDGITSCVGKTTAISQ